VVVDDLDAIDIQNDVFRVHDEPCRL
jgi:hypothetical protein